MFEEPEDETERDRPATPAERAREKLDQFRVHAELAAVFEGNRKFDARIKTDLKADAAREVQKLIGKLEKGRLPDMPVIADESSAAAAELLEWPLTHELSTNDYHIYRRPGETMIVRWLAADEVDSFYKRLQAHLDAALNQFRDGERQSQEWKQDPDTLAYLDELDKLNISMEERYLRPLIREHRVFVLSTQSADEMDILHLSDFIMGLPAAEIVGEASAPPDAPSDEDRAWYFKLFALRGMSKEAERMCFFTYLQKTGDEW